MPRKLTYGRFMSDMREDVKRNPGSVNIASLIAGSMALVWNKPNEEADQQELMKNAATLMKQPAFKKFMKDPRTMEIAKTGDVESLAGLLYVIENDMREEKLAWDRSESVHKDKAFMDEAVKSLKEGGVVGRPAELEKKDPSYIEMMKQVEAAQQKMERGLPLTPAENKSMTTAIKKYINGPANVPGGKKKQPYFKQAMCVLKEFMPKSVFDSYLDEIKQAHPKRSLEAESFNRDRMNGKVFTAEELKNQAKNRLRVRFTEDSCAQLMAVRNLSKGKNGAMITPEALEKEKARLMQGGSAFRRAMSSSAEREEYKKMAEKGQISDLTEALRKSTRNHAVGASQFRLNRAANALTEGPVNKHFASQYLSEILLAHEISTKMDPGLRTSNQGFAAGAEQIRKDPAFGQLVDKYMTDEVFRNRMNKDLQLDKTGGMLALEYHKMKAPAKQAEAQQNEAQPQPQPAV
ncbi:MAG: hypothetical protein II700_08510 [Firmicutes bacterium]|nr:hypothetical protein [Bacillota bacterium]